MYVFIPSYRMGSILPVLMPIHHVAFSLSFLTSSESNVFTSTSNGYDWYSKIIQLHITSLMTYSRKKFEHP